MVGSKTEMTTNPAVSQYWCMQNQGYGHWVVQQARGRTYGSEYKRQYRSG